MDITFIVISIVFIIFIIIAYFLKVLRLSIPLVMIYFIFCFSYLIDNDNDDYNLPKKINKQNIKKTMLMTINMMSIITLSIINEFWSERQDLNLRPLPPHGSALPDYATLRVIH